MKNLPVQPVVAPTDLPWSEVFTFAHQQLTLNKVVGVFNAIGNAAHASRRGKQISREQHARMTGWLSVLLNVHKVGDRRVMSLCEWIYAHHRPAYKRMKSDDMRQAQLQWLDWMIEQAKEWEKPQP